MTVDHLRGRKLCGYVPENIHVVYGEKRRQSGTWKLTEGQDNCHF